MKLKIKNTTHMQNRFLRILFKLLANRFIKKKKKKTIFTNNMSGFAGLNPKSKKNPTTYCCLNFHVWFLV